jgi:hypothetical protein
MTDEEKTILREVNRALKAKGIKRRLVKHFFWPKVHRLEVRFKNRSVAIEGRSVSVCDKSFGLFRRHHVGVFRGRGWLPRLVDAAVRAVEKEAKR